MRHMLMDPAYPDLVAAVAEEEAEEPRSNALSRIDRRERQAEMPKVVADVLRLLARLW